MNQLITCLFVLSFVFNSIGQGCSDAGFCTMGAMRPNQQFGSSLKLKLRSFEVSQYMGVSRFGDIINSTTAEFNISLTEKLHGQLKMPYTYMNGPLGSNRGTGDVSLSLTRAIVHRDAFDVNFSLGAKLPTTRANAERAEGVSLPMYYQSSLGTYDFISGVSLISRKWLFATGYQQVVYDANENRFLWGPWRQFDLFEEAQVYHSSIDLERGSDVMFRIERNFRFSKFNFFMGVLDVWRLNRDKVISPVTGERIVVEDSEGTSRGHAVTFLWGGGYNFSAQSSIKLLIGNRLVKRHINPDGLSREFVISSGYIFKF